MLALLIASALQAVQPGDVETFGRWAVGCDNGRACRAVSLLDHEDGGTPPMAIDRGPARSDRPTLAFPGGKAAPCTAFAMFIDGRRQAQTLYLRCGPAKARALAAATEAVMAAMRTADRLELRDSRGRVAARYSLKGGAATLRYMDSWQRRAGTVTALVARGGKPAAAVPPAPPLPVVREIRPGQPGKGPPLAPRLAEVWRSKHRCEAHDDRPSPSYRLDDRHYLFVLLCDRGSSDVWPLVLTSRRADGRDARAARFDYNSSYANEAHSADAPVNARWEEDRGRLTSGWSGECGFVEQWAWDGSRFRLVEHVEMRSGTIDRFSRNCSSSLDFWIPTWRATVVRGRRR